jgi:hypothetical protein
VNPGFLDHGTLWKTGVVDRCSLRSVSAVFEEIVKMVEPVKRLADKAGNTGNTRDCGDYFHIHVSLPRRRYSKY